MTMTPAEIERKVRQMDNDVQSIYELLDDLRGSVRRIAATQARHGNRLDELDRRLDAVDQRLDGIDQRLGSMESKMDEVLTLLRAR